MMPTPNLTQPEVDELMRQVDSGSASMRTPAYERIRSALSTLARIQAMTPTPPGHDFEATLEHLLAEARPGGALDTRLRSVGAWLLNNVPVSKGSRWLHKGQEFVCLGWHHPVFVFEKADSSERIELEPYQHPGLLDWAPLVMPAADSATLLATVPPVVT